MHNPDQKSHLDKVTLTEIDWLLGGFLFPEQRAFFAGIRTEGLPIPEGEAHSEYVTIN